MVGEGICNFLLAKNKKPEGKRSCPRGETGTTYEENDERRKKKRSERRQGIFLELKELNVTVGDHMYLELYKQKENEKEKPDLTTKRVVTSIKNLENRTSMASTPKVPKVFRPQVTPEAASSFVSPPKSRGERVLFEKGYRKGNKRQSLPNLWKVYQNSLFGMRH